jgi:hypothetical protein
MISGHGTPWTGDINLAVDAAQNAALKREKR